ncbi:MAG: hypothetical protein WDO24_27925 [Pseudomonadota bacterium]
MGEQERLAVDLGEPADELPADQRMQLGILVDRPVDLDQQPAFAQRREMLLQIGIATLGLGHGRSSGVMLAGSTDATEPDFAVKPRALTLAGLGDSVRSTNSAGRIGRWRRTKSRR